MSELKGQVQSSLGSSYTIDRELGGGGMSRVFVADETRLGRRVVIKVLSPELAAGISADRFEREIRMAASLQQANIVPVLSTGETNGLPYYTMPFVEGESLRHRLSQSPPLSISDIIRTLGDISRALQYAHERGIVHRDIKPDNVLLSGGTAVVTDFGIAKALSASRNRADGETLTQLGTSIGTPAYMAPEQAAGDPDVDHRADIYALGCLAFELFTGTPPFHGRPPARMLAAHMAEVPPALGELRPDAPAEVTALVMRCLEKDPAARPQSAADIISVLNGVTSGGGMTALPQVLMYTPGAFRRALVLYAAAVVAVAAIAKAATITIGLPEWVLPGALMVMALGLPVILFTGYVQRVTRRTLLHTPSTNAPQGTMATLALKASPHVSWRRTTRGGVYAVSGFVALIVVFMMLRAFGIGPAGSLFAAGALNQRDVILVSDFAVSHADSSVGSVVAEGVRANLTSSQSVTLYNPARVAAALTRMQQPPTAKLDLTLARQLAQREGVKAIVTGDVTGLGSGFVIALRLVSSDSGTVLASFQTTVDGPSQLVAGVDEVTRKLRGKIGESLKSVQASPPLAQVTTASYDALKAYTEGARAFDREHDFDKAIPLLRRAVAIDTGFATAWRKLGTALVNGGYPVSASDSAVTKAYQLRGRLTENERYLAEGYYFGSGPGHDRPKAMLAYSALIARGDSQYGANNLGVFYARMRDWVKAESLYRTSMRQNADNMIPLPNLILVLINQGKAAAVDSFTTLEAKKIPNSPSLVAHMFYVAVNAGNLERALTIVDSVQRVTKSNGVKDATASGRLALMGTWGRVNEAERAYHEEMSFARAVGNSSPAIVDSMWLAFMDGWLRKQPTRAAAKIDAALAAHPLAELAEQDRPYTDLARVYASLEQPARARAMLAQFAAIKDTAYYRGRMARVHEALGDIALAERRFAEAIPEYRRGDLLADGFPRNENPLSVHANLGRAFDLANQPDSAIAHFEAYVGTPFYSRLDLDGYYLAGTHKRLGELYQARGDNERAVSHLTKFVELWKNADPELQPAVADARRRLAQLAASRKS
ncbi:MAG: protein kinase [Gemmatimonadaceae bacterium]